MKKIAVIILISVLGVGVAVAQDSLKVLCIGNSFTYVHDTHLKLKEIANSQGHPTSVRASYAGGMSFWRHLISDKTMKAFAKEDLDVIFLQEQSMLAARYADNPKRWFFAIEDAKNLVARARAYNPSARIVLECDWSYSRDDFRGFHSYEAFDAKLQEGTALYLDAMNSTLQQMEMKPMDCISPIGKAFALVRTERPDIDLIKPDNLHQTEFGAYLKACVNYLVIYGGTFSENTSNCGLDSTICAYLRTVAERVVTPNGR